MRDALKLQTLKRSPHRKHQTIYKKAHRIISEGFETPVLSDKKIIALAEKFPTLTVKPLIAGNISIQSFKDEWIIVDEGRFYTLYHKSLGFDKGRIKERFHLQDVFKDLNYIFASVVSHDDYTMGIKKRTPEEVEYMANMQ